MRIVSQNCYAPSGIFLTSRFKRNIGGAAGSAHLLEKKETANHRVIVVIHPRMYLYDCLFKWEKKKKEGFMIEVGRRGVSFWWKAKVIGQAMRTSGTGWHAQI